MTDRRFPVANTDPPLTIPWEVAEWVLEESKKWVTITSPDSREVDIYSQMRGGGFTEDDLDAWAPRWREQAR